MTEKIYIARHGLLQTELDQHDMAECDWSPSRPTFDCLRRGEPISKRLFSHGLGAVTQAAELNQYFLSFPEEERPTAIFSSPYYRCLQTSRPLAKALGVPIYVEHGIAEWYSPVAPGTGLHPRPGSTESLKAFFSEIDPSWSTIYYPSRKGETVEEVHDRVDEFLVSFFATVAQRLPLERRRRLLFVTHAATTIALVRSFVGDRELHLKVGCCSISELDRHTDGVREGQVLGAFKAIALASGEHLKGGSSREWGFEDIEVEKGRVVEDPGVPGSEGEKDEPVGLQLDNHLTSNL